VLGAIFVGCVHDLSALVLSVRHRGLSIGMVAADLLGRRAKSLFHAIIFFGVALAMGVFVIAIAGLFSHALYPQAILPSAGLMIVAALWAPAIGSFGGLFAYLQQAFSILVPPVAAIFLLGIFWRRGDAPGALATLLGGHALGILVFILAQTGTVTTHFTINAGIMTAVSGLIFVVVSLATLPPPREDIAETTWRPALAVPERSYPWYQDYRVLGAIVLALTTATVVTFW